MLLIGFFLALGVFLALRYFALWYFRLDSIADNLEKIAKHTEYLAAQTPPAGFSTLSAPSSPAPLAPIAPAAPPVPAAPLRPAAPRRFPIGGGAHP
jgi:hypothetical protein